MWYGKCAIIMTLFSFAVLFSMYYISTMFPTSDMATTANKNWSVGQVKTLVNSFSILTNLNAGQNPNPSLIFGDFLVGATVLFTILSGGAVTTIFNGIPGFDSTNMTYLIQIIYGSACGTLWVFVIANRSL